MSQYRQLVRSAPGGLASVILAIIFGMYCVLYLAVGETVI